MLFHTVTQDVPFCQPASSLPMPTTSNESLSEAFLFPPTIKLSCLLSIIECLPNATDFLAVTSAEEALGIHLGSLHLFPYTSFELCQIFTLKIMVISCCFHLLKTTTTTTTHHILPLYRFTSLAFQHLISLFQVSIQMLTNAPHFLKAKYKMCPVTTGLHDLVSS